MKIKYPNAALYFLAYIFIYPLLKICFRLEVDRRGLDLPKGSHIVLANHHTMVDFLFVMLSIYPHRLNPVAAQKWFFIKPLNKLLPILGCIPKNMFDPDIRSVIGIKTVLKRDCGILMFPEGRCSSSGAYVGMHKSTGKLIKKSPVPVISCFIEGASICLPHWRKGFRFGRVRVTYRNLFSIEQIESMSIDEINNAIDARLSGDEGVPPTDKPFKTSWARQLTEGLNNVLFYCPKCEKEFTLVCEGNMIRCTSCGNAANMDCEGKLHPTPGSTAPEDMSIWYRNQVRHVMKSISADMEPIIDNVKVLTPTPKSGVGFVESGSGTMRVDPKGWRFEGNLFGERANLFFPVDVIPAMSYDHNHNFQIYHSGDFYMFVPEDPRMCIKYMIIAECTHWMFSSRILLTPGKNSAFANGAVAKR